MTHPTSGPRECLQSPGDLTIHVTDYGPSKGIMTIPMHRVYIYLYTVVHQLSFRPSSILIYPNVQIHTFFSLSL